MIIDNREALKREQEAAQKQIEEAAADSPPERNGNR